MHQSPPLPSTSQKSSWFPACHLAGIPSSSFKYRTTSVSKRFSRTAVGAAIGGGISASLDAPSKLAGVFCYAGTANGHFVCKTACQTFNDAVFNAQANVNLDHGPAGSIKILAWVFAYFVDIRGLIMAVCGIAAGYAIGYLIRRQSESTT